MDDMVLFRVMELYGHRVVSKRDKTESDDWVYVGRPSILGNPFFVPKMDCPVERRAARMDACTKHYRDLFKRINLGIDTKLIDAIKALDGKGVICYCSNGTCSELQGAKQCHGHNLILAERYLNTGQPLPITPSKVHAFLDAEFDRLLDTVM